MASNDVKIQCSFEGVLCKCEYCLKNCNVDITKNLLKELPETSEIITELPINYTDFIHISKSMNYYNYIKKDKIMANLVLNFHRIKMNDPYDYYENNYFYPALESMTDAYVDVKNDIIYMIIHEYYSCKNLIVTMNLTVFKSIAWEIDCSYEHYLDGIDY